jgi:hypothetical protein
MTIVDICADQLVVDDLTAEVERLHGAGVPFRNDLVGGPGGAQIWSMTLREIRLNRSNRRLAESRLCGSLLQGKHNRSFGNPIGNRADDGTDDHAR